MDDEEYSLHLEFSPSVTEADKKSVSLLMEREIINIATGTRVDEEETKFLVSSISLGESARDEFTNLV